MEMGSRGSLSKYLKRIVELKAELHIFILQKMNILDADLFHDGKKLSTVCYLADNF